MNLIEQFKKSWHRLQPATAPVLLAVSGGLDSMVMAHLFLNANIEFAMAHCNFGLRNDESDADEDFVKRWCDRHEIRFFVAHFDTKKKAQETGLGTQETARNLRYAWFEKIRSTYQFSSICTAHHADDNAETMLMNLCRGTGIAGLHGIPERNGAIIRPLLFADRKTLQDYAGSAGIDYRNDSSNESDDYLRNALRHHVLPKIEALMPGAAGRMLETSKHIAEAEEIYLRSIETERKKLLQPRGKDFYVPIKLLKHRKPLNTICYELFKPFGFTAHQIPFVVDDLLNAESGKFIISPTHRLIRNRDFLIITSLQEQDTDLILIEDFNQDVITANGSFKFEVLNKIPSQFEQGNTFAYVDIDKLEQPLILRRWKTGDYFYPLGMGMKKKKLSRFLIDQKMPIHEKEAVWVLESNKRIVWIAGLRLDERFKIKPSTQNVMRITKS